MRHYDSSESRLKSLSSEIHEIEAQVLERQRRVGLCAGALVQKTQRQLIAPSNLLLAGGIGFIIGELMKIKSPHSHHPAKDSRAMENGSLTGILVDALNTFNTISSMYTAFRASMKPGEAQRRE